MSLFSPTFQSIRDLYINELRDLYRAETQLLKALPKMAEAASAPELRRALTLHLSETRMQTQRLEQIFEDLGEKAPGEICEAMRGLIEEGEQYVEAGGDDDVRDAGLIAAAQRVEHYEIAGYGSAFALAQSLGETTAARSLQRSLDEESAADRKLTAIAEGLINRAAAAAV